jgi:hypothetical protein
MLSDGTSWSHTDAAGTPCTWQGVYRRRIEQQQPSDSVSQMPIEQVCSELQACGIDTTAATVRVLAAVHAVKQSQPQAGLSERLKCKFCGAAAKAEGEGWRAECGSWEFGRDAWDRSNGCYLRCAWRTQALELDELRQQVREAVGRLTALGHVELIDSPGAFGVVEKLVDDLRKAVGDE